MVVRLSNLYGGNLWAKVRRRLYNEIVPGDKDGWRKQKNKKQKNNCILHWVMSPSLELKLHQINIDPKVVVVRMFYTYELINRGYPKTK